MLSFTLICQVCVSASSKCLHQPAQMSSDTMQSPWGVSIQSQTHYESTVGNFFFFFEENNLEMSRF